MLNATGTTIGKLVGLPFCKAGLNFGKPLIAFNAALSQPGLNDLRTLAFITLPCALTVKLTITCP